MKSYIKIFGPPVLEAIRELEKIAVGLPQVRIWDTVFARGIPKNLSRDVGGQHFQNNRLDWIGSYFEKQGVSISRERIKNIVSSSGSSIGNYDFFFEWLEGPTFENLTMLIEKIDNALAPLGCRYTITTLK
ncbi:hypothetical protein CL673_00690 [Candidatus Bathyarchaeota archaeon]|jgi:hypothetical protein|nr:hypothetical protein [Candidatus Bathyarchaeota archaeon]MDP6048658.1 hypothetical protein [Candidatus Bathyarchaeota archaeon]MDP7442980.1 hypothetical protein [Candidatus Bathyarchaeota archaeon]|tara:strand:- start:76 stop:468 length:393 start_codon:yes stop_codon:yes gene_type:complete